MVLAPTKRVERATEDYQDTESEIMRLARHQVSPACARGSKFKYDPPAQLLFAYFATPSHGSVIQQKSK